jgi:hypothetical protein
MRVLIVSWRMFQFWDSAPAAAAISVPGLQTASGAHLSAASVSPKIISERLGHTIVTSTLDRYVHHDLAAYRHAVSRDGLFRGFVTKW